MSNQFAFPGGIETVAVQDVEAFDGTGEIDITVQRNNIAEGFDIPDPSAVTAALADDREVRMGVDQSLSLRFTNLPTVDFDKLDRACNEAKELFVKVTSTNTDANGDPAWEVTYKRVILSHVAHSPANADRSAYGVVMADGMCTGSRPTDVYSITQNNATA